MRTTLDSTGFVASARKLGVERQRVALAALVTSVTLAFATVVAAMAVTVGIAHADVIGNVIDNEASLFAIALLLGLLFIGMGGLTILTLPHHLTLPGHKPKHRNTSHHFG